MQYRTYKSGNCPNGHEVKCEDVGSVDGGIPDSGHGPGPGPMGGGGNFPILMGPGQCPECGAYLDMPPISGSTISAAL